MCVIAALFWGYFINTYVWVAVYGMYGFGYGEYIMKSKILKGIILASAIVFVNCGEEFSTAPSFDNNQSTLSSASIEGGNDLSSASVTDPNNPNDPWSDPCVASSLPDACGPGTNPLPTSSADAQNPASSADAANTVSSAGFQLPVDTVPAVNSSSSVVPPASSADVQKPASSSNNAATSSATVAQSSSDAATSSATVASSSSDVSASSTTEKTIFLAEGKEEEKDLMKVVYKTNTGWDRGGILAYPEKLSSTQKHGVVVWGPGGGTEPGAYEGMIRRLASHGFVVIALKESPGDASQAIKALDWMDQQNKDSNSPLYGKLDMNTVGCSGHSMGGLESEQAVIKDKRVLTAFLNNSGDWNGAGANKVATDRTIAILFGEVGMEKDNAKNDYNNAGVKAPACLIEMTGGPRNSEGGYGHGSGSWDGMAATVAWMRWHLGGETERKADFVGSSGKYIDGSIIGKQGKWKTQCKNF